jgi:hypothetical protein
MELNAYEAAEVEEHEEREHGRNRLNNIVAVTIVLLVTFMGIGKVKQESLTLLMNEAQANKIDYWMWYQARNIRQDMAGSVADQFDAAAHAAPPALRSDYVHRAGRYRRLSEDQKQKKDRVKADADRFQAKYDSILSRVEQFHLSEAGLSIAIAVLAITSLTQRRWLYWLSMVPASFGTLMGLAGFLNWHIHSELFGRIFGA